MNNISNMLGKAKILTRDEQIALVDDYQKEGNSKSLNKLVGSNVRMAKQIANQHKRNGIDTDDLFQSAVEGIVIAANKYKVGSKMAFSTYARMWMVAKCQENVRANFGTIRAGSRCAKTMYASLPKFRRAFVAQHGREPEAKEIARHFGYAVSDVEEVLAHIGKWAKSINVPIGDDSDEPLESTIPNKTPNPEMLATRKERILMVRKEINSFAGSLKGRDREIFVRHIVNGESGSDVGAAFHVSRQRVSQIAKGLKAKFKAHLKKSDVRFL